VTTVKRGRGRPTGGPRVDLLEAIAKATEGDLPARLMGVANDAEMPLPVKLQSMKELFASFAGRTPATTPRSTGADKHLVCSADIFQE
jgi:hypothetical protein